MNFLKIIEIPIMHVTHINADPDSFAGVLWGKEVFGGCTFIDNPDIATKNLMKKIGFRERKCKSFTLAFFYDVDKLERMPCFPERVVVFDHHPKNVFLNLNDDKVKVFHRKRASLSMYLYDISSDAGINLSDDVLISFAAAIVTDTAFLRTARSEELLYLSKFLDGRKMEDIFEIVLGGRISWKEFLLDLNRIKFCKDICYGDFSNENHFLFFVDSIMYALSCKIVVGRFKWGIWVYTKKEHIQEVFSRLKALGRDGYVRKGGKLYGIKDMEEIVAKLCDV